MAGNAQIRRYFPAAFAVILETQYQHSQGVEGKTPNNAKRVGLAQDVYVAPAPDNREKLEKNYQVDDPMSGSKPWVRIAKPVCQYAILRHPIQYSIGADDGGVDCAGKDQKADHHYERTEQ